MNLHRLVKTKPYFIFLAIAVLPFFLAVFCYFLETTLAINIHDTYFVIAHFHLFLMLGIWCLLCGLGYWFIKNNSVPYIPWIIYIHIIGSLVGLLQFVGFFDLMDAAPRLPNSLGPSAYMIDVYMVVIALFLFSQCMFFYHLVFSVFIKKLFFK